MALLMVLDKSLSVPYAGRSLGGGGGNYSNIRVQPDYFLLKWIIFKVCEHEYMNKCPYPIIDRCTALIPFTVIRCSIEIPAPQATGVCGDLAGD